MSGAPMTADALRARLERSPYFTFLGPVVDLRGDELTLELPFREGLIGNPLVPALHGGAIGALMEVTASAQLIVSIGLDRFPKTIDANIDYLRSGRPRATFARAVIRRQGARVANVQARAWQGERDRPIAVFHGHFMLPQGPKDA